MSLPFHLRLGYIISQEVKIIKRIRGLLISMSLKKIEILDILPNVTLHTMSHLVINRLEPPPLLSHPKMWQTFSWKKELTLKLNFRFYISWNMHIYYTKCIFHMDNYINLWSNSNPIVETIFVARSDITLWPRLPLPMSYFVIFLANAPPPMRIIYFLNGPLQWRQLWVLPSTSTH